MTDLLDIDGDPPPVTVLTALTGAVEPLVVQALDADPRTTVAHRCADLAELLSLAEAGRGAVAVVAPDLPRFDGDVVARLHSQGVRVVAVVDPDRDSSPRVAALGVDDVLPGGGDPAALTGAVVAAVLAGRAPAAAAGADTGWSGRPAQAPPGPPPQDDPGAPGQAVPAGLRMLPGWGPPDEPADGGATLLPTGDVPVPEAPGGEGRLVTVWGPPGSPGRTTVAVTLAAEAADQGLTVVLVDADTHAASIATHLGILDESSGLVGAVRAALAGRLDEHVLDTLAPVVAPRLRVLTGITRSARWPEARPAGVEATLRALRRSADLVVVDVAAPLDRDEEMLLDVSGPRRNAVTLLALQQADQVLAVGSADPIGLQRLVRALQELSAVGTGRPSPRVVLNKVRRSAVGPDPERRLRVALDRFASVADPVLVPWDPSGLDAALLAGRTLAEAVPGSPVRTPVRRLAGELTGLAAGGVPRSGARGRRRRLRAV